MIPRSIVLGVIWMLVIPTQGKAQQDVKSTFIDEIKSLEFSLSAGYVLPHREEMNALVTGHSTAIGLTWGHEVTEGWTLQRKTKHPIWQGGEVSWIRLGSEGMGSVWSGLWLNRFPLGRALFSEMGVGLGVATSPYDAVEAPFSFALGTRFNAGLRLAIGMHSATGHHGAWAIKLGMTHFSNGAMRMPNLGVNNIHMVLAKKLSSDPAPTRILPNRTTFFSHDIRYQLECSGRLGMRDIDLPGGPRHPTVTLHGLTHFTHSPTANWRIAAAQEICFNQSLRVTGSEDQRLQWSTLIGGRGYFGNTQVTVLQGYVLKNPDKQLGRRHLLVTLSQDINRRMGLEIGLRSFRLRADHAFLGVNWKFTRS